MSNKLRPVFCLGGGVDSAAILTRWILDPASRLVWDLPGAVYGTEGADRGKMLRPAAHGCARPFDLADLTVVMAMTGDEYAETAEYLERYLLPLLAANRVRLVQVSRAGQSDSDGIVVLDDTRTPTRMHMRGPWALTDELHAVPTVPQVAAGRRLCSIRAKGWVLDQWQAAEYSDDDHVVRIIGFAAEETDRAQTDTGYTADGTVVPDYPLIRWNWDRDVCQQYLIATYALERDWPRSCCSYCPFQAGPELPKMLDRWRRDPEAAVRAVVMESLALVFNPRMRLFGKKSARAVALAAGMADLVARADAELAAMPAAVYEVRRVYRRAGDRIVNDTPVLGPNPAAKGQAWRSLKAAHQPGTDTPITGVWERLADKLRQRGHDVRADVDVSDGTVRVWLKRVPDDGTASYPAVEQFLVVAPAGYADKERPRFDQLYHHAVSLDLPRQADLFAGV